MIPGTLSADIGLPEYIKDYRDAPRFEACCRACPAYGRRWSCPPLTFDADALLKHYRRITIYAV
ncbi:MAG: DUF2284 domain-containing protein, partial [Muribaculaceae bacterium]|nr:DUF2284 domain-containing protein [Muribaculaceae bacterium]